MKIPLWKFRHQCAGEKYTVNQKSEPPLDFFRWAPAKKNANFPAIVIHLFQYTFSAPFAYFDTKIEPAKPLRIKYLFYRDNWQFNLLLDSESWEFQFRRFRYNLDTHS